MLTRPFRRSVGVVPMRSVVLALSGVVVLSACGAVNVTTREARANRARATSIADQMLNQLSLPSRSQRISAPPSSLGEALRRPYESFWIASQVDRDAFWTTSSSYGAAITWIEAHLPRGVKRTDFSYEPGVDSFVTYTFPTIDQRTLGARQLVIEAFSELHGGAIVRADAEVRYIAPRPPDERIPAKARALQITVGSNPQRPLLNRTITNVSEVRSVAGFVDALPFVGNEQGVGFSCGPGLAGSPVDRFTFSATSGGAALAAVTVPSFALTTDDPCNTSTLVVRGRHEPQLEDGGLLLREAGALLNAPLTCTAKLVRVAGPPGHRSRFKTQCSVSGR